MNKSTKKRGLIQVDIDGNPIHVPEEKTYRMAKCGKCGETVKLSQTKLHLSFGKKLNICKRCLEEDSNNIKRRNSFGVIMRELPGSRLLNTIESYTLGMQ